MSKSASEIKETAYEGIYFGFTISTSRSLNGVNIMALFGHSWTSEAPAMTKNDTATGKIRGTDVYVS